MEHLLDRRAADRGELREAAGAVAKAIVSGALTFDKLRKVTFSPSILGFLFVLPPI